MRDPNERMLMSNLVKDSPMFDFVEEISGRSNQLTQKAQAPKKTAKQIQLEQAQRELELQAEELMEGQEIDKIGDDSQNNYNANLGMGNFEDQN